MCMCNGFVSKCLFTILSRRMFCVRAVFFSANQSFDHCNQKGPLNIKWIQIDAHSNLTRRKYKAHFHAACGCQLEINPVNLYNCTILCFRTAKIYMWVSSDFPKIYIVPKPKQCKEDEKII